MQKYEFGAPYLTRVSEIAANCKSADTYFRVEVMGEYKKLKQITIRIGLPVYRLENGRTRTFQKEYLATHPNVPSDLFTFDVDSLEAQKAQHTILQDLAKDEGLYKKFFDGTKQTEPIIITSTGVVVNGNRRLCAWRTLFYEQPERYKHFEYIQATVLPEECDEEEIRALEKRLQIQKTNKAEYKWHTKATMIKEEREKGESDEVLFKSYDLAAKKDVDTLIGALDYAEMYLQKIGKPNQWSLVDEDEFAFKSMVEHRHKTKGMGRKELFEVLCFKLIEDGDYKGRLYDAIPKLAESLDAVAEEIQEKKLMPENLPENNNHQNMSLIDGNNDDLDFLGGEDIEVDAYSILATSIQNSDVKLGALVKQVIDDQESLKNEQKSNRYLLNTLARIVKQLWNIEMAGLNEATITEGVDIQISTIKEKIERIEEWLKNR